MKPFHVPIPVVTLLDLPAPERPVATLSPSAAEQLRAKALVRHAPLTKSTSVDDRGRPTLAACFWRAELWEVLLRPVRGVLGGPGPWDLVADVLALDDLAEIYDEWDGSNLGISRMNVARVRTTGRFWSAHRRLLWERRFGRPETPLDLEDLE